jgi:CDP-paratose 2-epimerase
LRPEVWITETGFSTWKHDEYGQLRAFSQAIAAPVERVYWYAAYDLHPDLCTQDGFHADERHYHMGLKRPDGTPKLLYNSWANGGLAAVGQMAQLERHPDVLSSPPRPQPHPSYVLHSGLECPILITGGAGFIGTNLAHRLLSLGQSVLLFDNLSRPGVEQNLHWLHQQHGEARLQIQVADVRDRYSLRQAVQQAQCCFHFAAQVAVTTSLINPVQDFEVNAIGTLNLLEALRSLETPPPLIFTSTNKVYGGLEEIKLRLQETRYEPVETMIWLSGIREDCPLSFHSPYGCSKGAADQYVLDYARTFGLAATVFRMSCIYGTHQLGTEDQGWVAHFLLRAIAGRPITLFGDGRQVRDVLFIDDLVDAFLLAQANLNDLAGQAFNIGGGPENTTSLLELIQLIHELYQIKPPIDFQPWRPGDQRYYVSDLSKFQSLTGWSPQVSISEGVQRLYQWLMERKLLVLTC